MMFEELFISYKIGRKRIKEFIPYFKLPLHKKIGAIVIFSFVILSIVVSIVVGHYFSKDAGIYAGFTIIIVCLITFLIFVTISSSSSNLKTMLKKHYKPYSKERMDMVTKTLRKCKIDIYNYHELDLLIEEAKRAQVKCDYLLPLKKPFKFLGTVIVSVMSFYAGKLGETISTDNILQVIMQTIGIILIIFSFLILLRPVIKYALYRDYYYYDDLIHDLNQVKIFYSRTN